MTREDIETALDQRKLQIHMRSGNWWAVRRNGKTKTWKRNPDKFKIPIKYGMYGFGYIDQDNMHDAQCWRIDHV